MFGCRLQQNKEGPSNIAVYKETLANSFRRSVSFGDCADETPRQVSLGPEAAVEGLIALGFTAWVDAPTLWNNPSLALDQVDEFRKRKKYMRNITDSPTI